MLSASTETDWFSTAVVSATMLLVFWIVAWIFVRFIFPPSFDLPTFPDYNRKIFSNKRFSIFQRLSLVIFVFVEIIAALFDEIADGKMPKMRTEHSRKGTKSKPSGLFSFFNACLCEDSRRSLMSLHRDLLLDARALRENGESESAIRKMSRRQMVMAYFSFATAPLTRALRAPFRWRRD
jgi:hypothetical protein